MNPDLEVQETHKYGRGVFAKRDFAKGELLEKAPILFLPRGEWPDLEKTVVYNYCFYWKEDYAIALGVGSLFNHSYTPNSLYTTNMDDKTVDFRTLKDIQAGEEITVNYNGSPDDTSPVWFDVKE